MKIKYLEKEFRVLINKLYKALNIYEEENSYVIEEYEKENNVKLTNKRERKNSNRDTSKDIPFSDFVGLTIRTIEGVIFGLEYSEGSVPAIQELVRIKNLLHDMQYSRGVEEYRNVKRNLFDSCNAVKKLSENV